MTLDGNVARKEHGTPRNYRIYKVYGCESLNFRATILFILRSGNDEIVSFVRNGFDNRNHWIFAILFRTFVIFHNGNDFRCVEWPEDWTPAQ